MFTLDLSTDPSGEHWPDRMRKKVQETGLEISLETTLKTLPGSLHWHIKHPGKRGTLEFTYAPQDGRAWLSYHQNRYQPWMEVVIDKLVSTH